MVEHGGRAVGLTRPESGSRGIYRRIRTRFAPWFRPSSRSIGNMGLWPTVCRPFPVRPSPRVAPPAHETRLLVTHDADRTLNRTFLLKTPHNLIKFRTFHRNSLSLCELDYRLNRVRASHRFPVEVWARWCVNHPRFTNFILSLVIINSIFMGIESELALDQYSTFFNFIHLFDLCSLLIFIVEIALHWLDSFPLYWRSYWNCFDFAVTIISAIPTLLGFLEIGNSGLSTLASQLRIFRIFRSLKVVARFRNLRLITTTMLESVVLLI